MKKRYLGVLLLIVLACIVGFGSIFSVNNKTVGVYAGGELISSNGLAIYSNTLNSMYSMYDTAGYIMQAASAGVKGYISKVASEEELVRCLETVLSGKEYFEGKARGSLEKIEKISPLLTRQEKRILEKLLQQKSNEEIAGELFISLHTVENYVSYIYDKLCVKSRAELEAAFG